jgi:hypothetical protein
MESETILDGALLTDKIGKRVPSAAPRRLLGVAADIRVGLPTPVSGRGLSREINIGANYRTHRYLYLRTRTPFNSRCDGHPGREGVTV